MTKQVAFCGPEANLAQAVELMRKNACAFLPVAGKGGNVIGVITDRDISIALGTWGRRASQVRLGDVTPSQLVTRTTDDRDLRRVNRDLETFAYSASHDLQEPLRTIAISAELLNRSCGNRLQPDEAAFLTRILTAADRMLALVRDLHTYTESTKHAEGPPPAIIDSAKVLAGVLEILRPSIEAAEAIVTSTRLPLVSIYEARLGEILLGAARNGTISGGIGRSQWHQVDDQLAGIGKYSTSASKSLPAACF
jgi:signal transduction histidine kinase